jgi:hypothetical protein
MSLFCVLWMPLFYLFWVSVFPKDSFQVQDLWALFGGSLVAMLHFFIGDFVEADGFGFSRWLNGYIDVVCFPVLLPIGVRLLLSLSPAFGARSPSGFALLWLIPGAIVRTATWGIRHDPVHLVLVPLLWTALALGISLFIQIIRDRERMVYVIPALLGIPVLSLSAASGYWAFFSQKTLEGLLLFIITLVPLGFAVGRAISRPTG